MTSAAKASTAAELARIFPCPALTSVGDEIADGNWDQQPGDPLPLALFDAVRIDYSLRRLQHYTGTDWRDVQPWILLTNYHRYVDQFIAWGVGQLAWKMPAFQSLHLPGGGTIVRGMDAEDRQNRRGLALAPLPDAGLPPQARDGRVAASPSSISAWARPTPKRSPIIWPCSARIAG